MNLSTCIPIKNITSNCTEYNITPKCPGFKCNFFECDCKTNYYDCKPNPSLNNTTVSDTRNEKIIGGNKGIHLAESNSCNCS